MRREIEDRVVVDHEDDRMLRCRGVAVRDMRVHHSLASDRPTVEQPISRLGVGERAELPRQALVGGPGDCRHGAHEPVGASGIAKFGRPELGLGPMTGFIEHVRSLARPSEAAKSARDMRSLADKRKMWVTVRHIEPGLVRQYSVCNGPEDQAHYLIAVKREPQSRGGSAAMHER